MALLPGAQGQTGAPLYATVKRPGTKGMWVALVIGALLAGLGTGAFVFYRTHQQKRELAAAEQQTAPAVSPEATPHPVTPSPESDAQGTTKEHESNSPRKQTEPAVSVHQRPPIRRDTGAIAPGQKIDTAPGRQDPAELSSSAPAPAASTPARPTNAPSGPDHPVRPPARRAVQETQSESAPMPAAGVPNRQKPQSAPEPAVPAPLQPEGGASAPKPAYTGPMSGDATWMGKLDKNDVLTINGGTPSTGVLTGAPLPGVPVRLTVTQTNLGFKEFPNAGNGYRRLVLQSHGKHNKINFHWDVLQ